MSLSVSAASLTPQLPFLKEKKRTTRSGEEGRRHYRKSWQKTPLPHTQSAEKTDEGHEQSSVFCRYEAYFGRNAAAIATKLRVVSRARPSQR